MVWDDSSDSGIRTDKIGRVFVHDTHRRHLPQAIGSARHQLFASEDVVQKLLLAVMFPRPTDIFRDKVGHVE
jgi:hypothetical protein